MHIYVKNNSAKFRPDPIWNDGTLSYVEDGRSNNKKNKWWDQFLAQKCLEFTPKSRSAVH